MQLPRPGERFQTRYEIQEVLGRGGFAVVYRATDTTVGRDVAIKVLTPRHGGYGQDTVSRFLREARVHAGLNDPYTVVMFDFGRSDDGLLFMVFEYVRGRDLAHVLGDVGPLPEATVLHVLTQLGSALREAHGAGILHRDLKPANVLVYDYMGDDFRVKLLDFGIAKPVEQPADVSTITKTGAVIGTPRYMSPEQICGNTLGPTSDIYSLGLLAFEMLLGRPAIAPENTRQILIEQLSERPLRLPPDAPVSRSFRAVVERMCARDPAFRYSSAQEVIDALDAIGGRRLGRTGPRGVEAPPPDLRTEVRPPDTRVESAVATPVGPPVPESNASLLGTAAVALVGIAVGGGLIVGLLSAFTAEEPVRPVPEVADRGVQPVAQQRPKSEPEAVVEGFHHEDESEGAVAPSVRIEDPEEGKESEGCGAAPTFAGVSDMNVWVGGRDRKWTVYAPAAYDPSVRHPVVIALDADFLKGGDNALVAELMPVADEHDFVIVAPRSAEVYPAFDEAADPEFVRRALYETSRVLCLDPARVYAVGHASGCRFVEELLCELPLAAAAGSAHRATKKDHPCQPSPPVPFMYLVGDRDKFAPLKGGMACNGREVISLDAQNDIWKARNRCTGKRRTYTRRNDGTCRTWEDCEAAYVSCVVEGGHYWPLTGATFLHPLPTCATPGTTYPYATEVWKFFAKEGIARPDASFETLLR